MAGRTFPAERFKPCPEEHTFWLQPSFSRWSPCSFGADRLRLERSYWRLERADMAELDRAGRDRRPSLLRVQPCPTTCPQELFQLNHAGPILPSLAMVLDRLT